MIIKNVLNYSAYFLDCLAIAKKAVMHSRWLVWKCDDALSHMNWICHVIACGRIHDRDDLNIVMPRHLWWPNRSTRKGVFVGGGGGGATSVIAQFICTFGDEKPTAWSSGHVLPKCSLHLTACFNCTPQVAVDPFPYIQKRMHTTSRLPVELCVCGAALKIWMGVPEYPAWV